MGRKMKMTKKAIKESSGTTATKVLHLEGSTYKYADGSVYIL